MKKILTPLLLLACNAVFSQNVGIGTTDPKARLHVADSSTLFSANGWSIGSSPSDPPAQGMGRRMMWYVNKAAFRVGAVTENAWNKDSIGNYSFATGLDAKAKGLFSAAIGLNNNANNWYNFVAGAENTTQGVASAAIGYNNIVNGAYSLALGNSLVTKGHDNAYAIGANNDTSTFIPGFFLPQYDQRIFQVGNGLGNARSNALTVLQNGNTGIGTVFPMAKLHVDSAVLFTGKNPLPFPAAPTPVTGAGTRMMWYPDKAAFRAGTVAGDNWNKENIGYFSIAGGYDALAKGDQSIALGGMTEATGEYAVSIGNYSNARGNRGVALGYVAQANGYSSFAAGFAPVAASAYSASIGNNNLSEAANSFTIGTEAIARNPYSFSMGYQTISKNDYLFSLGKFNDTTGSNKIFEIGNGTANESRKNAITILENGNTGIGTVQPAAALHVANKSVLFSLPNNFTVPPSNPPVSGGGNRFMWYAEKAAFRAGGAEFSEWDNNNTGYYSMALGYRTRASQRSTIALGEGADAIGSYAIAMGYYASASGPAAVATGQGTVSIGAASFSCGHLTQAGGDFSFSSGNNTSAKAMSSFTAGNYNDLADNPNPNIAAPNDRIFQVGNGADLITRSNAVTILRNGNAGIGTVNPATRLDVAGRNNWDLSNTEGDFRIGNDQYRIKMGVALGGGGAGASIIRAVGGINLLALGAGNQNMVTLNGANGFVGVGLDNPSQKLHVAGNILATGTITPSDMRYKKNIHAITDPLQKVQQINGVTYQYKADEFPENGFDNTTQVGLIAQDVEKVFPQLVFTDDKGYKAVDYTKLIPLLIEGMKAQQQQIETLKEEVNKLKSAK